MKRSDYHAVYGHIQTTPASVIVLLGVFFLGLVREEDVWKDKLSA